MTITIVVPPPEEVRDYVVWAYLSRLYMPQRCLQYDYWRCLEANPRKRYRWMFKGQYYSRAVHLLAIALDQDQEPIGIAYLNYWNLQVYVRKRYRRQGIACELVNSLVGTLTNERFISVGFSNAPKFYQRVLPQQYGVHDFFRKINTT